MLAIKLPYLFGYAVATEPLMDLPKEVPFGEVSNIVLAAAVQIDAFHSNSVYSATLRSSHDPAHRLVQMLNELIGNFDHERQFTAAEAMGITLAYAEYKSALWAELSVMAAYFVTRKPPYDTYDLINDGASLFPIDMTYKVEDTSADAAEAGKALAFEMPTACGYHTFRIVEAVLRVYWDTVTNGVTRPVPQTLGNMAGQLESLKFGDEKVRSTISQMAKLHRNPLAHPDVILTMEEAKGTLGMARSAIDQMLSVLPDPLPSTSNPFVAD